MYHCTDCGKEFLTPRLITETHGLSEPPYERIFICPICGSERMRIVQNLYCRCCGARLPEFRFDYCNERCRKRGELLWLRETHRRLRRETDPLEITVAAAERYNREHGTSYSYGQYVALVLEKEQKNDKRSKKRVFE